MTTVRRVVLVAVLVVLSVVSAGGIASASSACPRCPGHGDKAGGDYVVRDGDTLSEIAAAHRVTVAQLYAQNREVLADPDRIYTGQRLLVGAPAARVLPVSYRVGIVAGGKTVAALAVGQLAGYRVTVARTEGGYRTTTTRASSRDLIVVNLTGTTITVVVTRAGVTVKRLSVHAHGTLAIVPPNRYR